MSIRKKAINHAKKAVHSDLILMTGLTRPGMRFKSAALFKVPEYHPYIKIRIPRDDVKIIYRALPRNGQIAVYN